MKTKSRRQGEQVKAYVTLACAVQRTRLDPSTLKGHIASGEIRAYRIGRRILRLDADDLPRFSTSSGSCTVARMLPGS